MTFRPLPRHVTRPLSFAILVAWVVQMGLLIDQAYLQAAPVSLASDLARYGAAAQWRGVYYRGEKIGFVVGQTLPLDEGYELQEDGQLQMTLMGVTSPALLATRLQVDQSYNLRSFTFSLSTETSSLTVAGALDGRRLDLEIGGIAGTRTESRELPEVPVLALNLPRRLAAQGLETGKRFEISVFDPATLTNAPMRVEVGAREVVRAAGRPVPAFRLETEFAGVQATSWVTDVGEVVKEESPMGLVVVRETREAATAMALTGEIRADMLEGAAVVPETSVPIDDPLAVESLRLRVDGIALEGPEVQGAGQRVADGVVEIRISEEDIPVEAAGPARERYLGPETLIESDAPEIVAEARRATEGLTGARERAERLVRHVNALLEKKPTVSIPSALEVLRSGVGDCNEHTALYVALARALGIPARIAVGLVNLRGNFYYHAWPEVFVESGAERGRWLPVDPTLNQFPADGTHLRVARGGLDQQARLLPAIGRMQISVLDIRLQEGTNPVLVGREVQQGQMPVLIPQRDGEGTAGSCWSFGGS